MTYSLGERKNILISHNKKCLFIHVPKTGGYTIKDILKNYSNDIIEKGYDCLRGKSMGWKMFPEKGNFDKHCGLMHGKMEFYYKTYGNELIDSYHKFSVVRNPWDRLLAYSLWINGGVFEYSILKKIIYTPEDNIGIGEAVQSHYWKNEDKIKIDTFIRFENFNEELKKLLVSLNISFNDDDLKEKKNSTNHGHYSEYYQPAEKSYVEEMCSEVINMFNYNFD